MTKLPYGVTRALVGEEHYKFCQQAYDEIRHRRKHRKGPMDVIDKVLHEVDKTFEAYYKTVLVD